MLYMYSEGPLSNYYKPYHIGKIPFNGSPLTRSLFYQVKFQKYSDSKIILNFPL